MPVSEINGVEINYSLHGDLENPVVMLIHGLGQPAASWPEFFVDALLEHGFCVLTHDNRDMGKSQKFDHLGVPNIAKMVLRSRFGLSNKAPFTLEDMMRDSLGLLEHLQLNKVHVVGASMGGMIAQLLAINAPQHIQSLCSIMSHTGNPKLPTPKLKVMRQLLAKPKSWEFEDRLTFSMRTWRLIGSPAYPSNEEELRAYVSNILENGAHPAGTARQMAAILSATNRVEQLRQLQTPTLVIHGDADPLVHVAGGKETAESIANAKLEIIPGMGHDLPKQLNDKITQLIVEHINTSV